VTSSCGLGFFTILGQISRVRREGRGKEREARRGKEEDEERPGFIHHAGSMLYIDVVTSVAQILREEKENVPLDRAATRF
jgi:hypothetical protein